MPNVQGKAANFAEMVQITSPLHGNETAVFNEPREFYLG